MGFKQVETHGWSRRRGLGHNLPSRRDHHRETIQITVQLISILDFHSLHLPYIYIYRIINTNYGSLDFNIVSKYIRMIDCRTGW